MRQSASRFMVITVLILLAVALTACGGGGSSANTVAKLNITPAFLSLNRGATQQISVQPVDSSGAAVFANIAYDSSNKDAVTVSTSGLVCAGQWDANFIVCTPQPDPVKGIATVNITVTSQSVTTTVPVSVHERVDIVNIVPSAAGCVSMAGTAQFSAKALTRDAAACARLGTVAPCELPAATLGEFTFVSNDSQVVSFDNTTAAKQGIATAGIPGQTSVFASLSTNNSPSVTFQTCPITSLSITVKDSTAAPFAIDKGSTKAVVATAVDSSGKTLTTPPIEWNSSQPFAVTTPVATSTDNLTINATGSAPGFSTISASCVTPACNRGLDPIHSNLIPVTVNGSAAGVVYAASTTSKTVVPIDMATNTAGTAITIQNLPNSFLADRTGSKAVLGSDTFAMLLDLTTNTSAQIGLPGRVLAVAPDAQSYALTNATTNNVGIFALVNTAATGAFTVPGGADAADFTPDGKYLIAIARDKMYRFNVSVGSFETAIGATSRGVAALAQGSASLISVPGQVQVRATCNSSLVDSPAATNPTLVAAVPNGDGALIYDNGNLVRLSGTTLNQSCPPSFNANRSVIDIHGGGAVARQLLVSPDSTKAFVTTNTGNLLTYNLTTGAATPIPLVNATESYTMAISLDGKMLYVGAKDGKVHRIDTTTMTDVQQIDPGLKQTDGTTVAVPDLIVMRNK